MEPIVEFHLEPILGPIEHDGKRYIYIYIYMKIHVHKKATPCALLAKHRCDGGQRSLGLGWVDRAGLIWIDLGWAGLGVSWAELG